MSVSYLPPPVPVRPSMTALQLAMAEVLAEPVDDSRAAAEVDALLVLRSQVDAALLSRLADVERSGAWTLDGSVTQAAWLRNRGNLGRGDAGRTTTLARRLAQHGHVAAALQAGRITADHAVAVCTALRQIDVEMWAEQEPLFVRAAELTDPITLGAELSKRTSALAPLPADQATQRRRDQRRFTLNQTLDGVWHLSGLLDPEAGALLQTAISAQRRTDHSDGDTRTPAQRDADALVHLARLACERGELPSAHRVRPHLLVLTPVEQLAGRSGAELATLVDGEPLTPNALQRLACDAMLTRMVLDPTGLPLDVGRTQRTVPRRSGSPRSSATAAAPPPAAGRTSSGAKPTTSCRSARAATPALPTPPCSAPARTATTTRSTTSNASFNSATDAGSDRTATPTSTPGSGNERTQRTGVRSIYLGGLDLAPEEDRARTPSAAHTRGRRAARPRPRARRP